MFPSQRRQDTNEISKRRSCARTGKTTRPDPHLRDGQPDRVQIRLRAKERRVPSRECSCLAPRVSEATLTRTLLGRSWATKDNHTCDAPKSAHRPGQTAASSSRQGSPTRRAPPDGPVTGRPSCHTAVTVRCFLEETLFQRRLSGARLQLGAKPETLPASSFVGREEKLTV